jgi:hypothetical protein
MSYYAVVSLLGKPASHVQRTNVPMSMHRRLPDFAATHLIPLPAPANPTLPELYQESLAIDGDATGKGFWGGVGLKILATSEGGGTSPRRGYG